MKGLSIRHTFILFARKHFTSLLCCCHLNSMCWRCFLFSFDLSFNDHVNDRDGWRWASGSLTILLRKKEIFTLGIVFGISFISSSSKLNCDYSIVSHGYQAAPLNQGRQDWLYNISLIYCKVARQCCYVCIGIGNFKTFTVRYNIYISLMI